MPQRSESESPGTRATHEGELPMRANQAMAEGVEFDLIRMLMAKWGDIVADIGDDAAVLPAGSNGEQQIISTDSSVEGVHFRRPWLSAEELGWRAAAAALSDLAAMGGKARYVLVSMVLPESWHSALAELAGGIGAQVRSSGARIVGGNLSRGDSFSVTLTVIGSAGRPVPRSGARVGDLVVVTGLIGGPGAALKAWSAGEEPGAWARERFVHPVPRFVEASLLAQAGASAMIDISDGLAADARHIGAASGVRLMMDSSRLPLGPGIEAGDAWRSGEEYELLATLPVSAWELLQADWLLHTKVPISVIGRVLPEVRGEGINASQPDMGALDPASGVAGHDHFR